MISIESLTYPLGFKRKINWKWIGFNWKPYLSFLDFKRSINWKWIDFNWKPYLSFLISKGKSIERKLISIESLTYPFRFQKENQLKVNWFQLKALLILLDFKRKKSIEGELISIESLSYPFRFQKEKINWT